MRDNEDFLHLTTTDADDGETQYVDRLTYVRDRGRVTATGDPAHAPEIGAPRWYRNLLAHPMARVQTADDDYWAVAVPAEDAGQQPMVHLDRSYVEGGPDEVATVGDKLLEVHRWLRGQVRLVQAETRRHLADRAAAAPAPPLDLQIRQHCLAFCEALALHHHSEDAHMFPALRDQYPHLQEALAQLAAEHETVARLLQDMGDLLADVARADSDVFTAELTRLSTEVESHLDYEEETVLPVLADIPLPDRPAADEAQGGTR